MAPTRSLLVAALAGVVAAFPGMHGGGDVRRKAYDAGKLAQRAPSAATSSAASSSTYPAWQAPTADDVRSPCPGLNTLANHDICPRSGRGYTIPILTECLATGMNMGADFSLIVGTAGIGSNPDTTELSFDLDMLDRHDQFIEHDASLSRAEYDTGNDYSFNETIWNTVLAYYNDSTDATIATAGAARLMRLDKEEADDSDFDFGPLQLIFQTAETAIYLSVMGDPITGVAPTEYVRSLFEEERLPYELGWTPPTVATTIPSLLAMSLEIMASTGETFSDGAILTEYSFAAAWLGINGFTNDVEDSSVYSIAKLTGALATLNSTLTSLL